MNRLRQPRIVPPLGSLGVAKAASHFPHIQALCERGGQIDLGYTKIGAAIAFGVKGAVAAVRASAHHSIAFHLHRLDRAIAIGQSTRTRVDEILSSSRMVPIGVAGSAEIPGLRLPNIQSLLKCGGCVAFGNCRPGAAVAVEEKEPLAILAPISSESVEDLLRRLDWAISLAKSQGITIDEVFAPSGLANAVDRGTAGQTSPSSVR